MEQNRAPEFQRSDQLQRVLQEVNQLLGGLPLPDVETPKLPLIFIIGCPRSGTTLFLQWLSTLGLFGYPSNLIARFYQNPYLGARIQQMLIDFDPKQQIFPDTVFNFSSRLGHTKGALAPSEFWYFWRLFFKFEEIQKLSADALQTADTSSFLKHLAAFEYAVEKPLAMKAMLLNWNIPFLHKLFDKCLIINIEREDVFNAQSLYLSRLAFFNDAQKWFSLKPPEYKWLKQKSPLHQVAGQVHFMKKAIRQGLSTLPMSDVLTVKYSEFCTNPASFHQTIQKKLEAMGYSFSSVYQGEKTFNHSNQVKLTPNDFEELTQHCRSFS